MHLVQNLKPASRIGSGPRGRCHWRLQGGGLYYFTVFGANHQIFSTPPPKPAKIAWFFSFFDFFWERKMSINTPNLVSASTHSIGPHPGSLSKGLVETQFVVWYAAYQRPIRRSCIFHISVQGSAWAMDSSHKDAA